MMSWSQMIIFSKYFFSYLFHYPVVFIFALYIYIITWSWYWDNSFRFLWIKSLNCTSKDLFSIIMRVFTLFLWWIISRPRIFIFQFLRFHYFCFNFIIGFINYCIHIRSHSFIRKRWSRSCLSQFLFCF